ncbi:Aldolase-II domain-containing protein [Fusarium keratoplasticum]|uniref:Aldolase-II domain-containing protein n=1 Tax=Fusarium keratoplasticum TaxID=1328300 RepID=A0ACC0QFK9_9HYPO|nr:Aldolase-II domain-containing protein [Fusarium keratoplasticum]KAI8652192.1 Aldolase-II domain-containing protein [Fusarium keratoplasticum]KAI8652934.1 Aldolase-II domain-containing protein [Fusarium keratoplasticum]
MAPHSNTDIESPTTDRLSSEKKRWVPHAKEGKTALEALSQGMTLAGIPKFPSYHEERTHILEHMASAFRIFARKGFAEGMAGHISVRDPENPHTFWTNPLGRPWPLMLASDMVLVDYDGKAVGGNMSRPSNAAGFLIHSALHKARPDVNAACHAHTVYGKAWSTFGRPLEMINQDACVFYDKAQAVYEDFGGVVFDEDEGKRLAEALGPEGKVMTLTNHGLLTVGQTVDEAAYLFTLMEKSCQIQLLAEAAAANGIPKRIIDDDVAAYTFKMTSSAESLYCEFQPDFEVEDALSNGAFRK